MDFHWAERAPRPRILPIIVSHSIANLRRVYQARQIIKWLRVTSSMFQSCHSLISQLILLRNYPGREVLKIIKSRMSICISIRCSRSMMEVYLLQELTAHRSLSISQGLFITRLRSQVERESGYKVRSICQKKKASQQQSHSTMRFQTLFVTTLTGPQISL